MADDRTKGIVMIGEIGGNAEDEASHYIKSSRIKKPIVGFIAGSTAPEGKRMGHAGAIVSGSSDTAEHKMEVMRSAGIRVAESPAAIGSAMLELMNK